ncbi:DHH family phosphoesterase [Methanofollis tationis]|uniref:DHH family phosphoesterase n=1 Tax=Methanofollis tationis TaxID=81417 RepID=A0A7K4HQE2_9EURY|nr:DHHA1 domain-containing protein [Methanofollis tationis]NVO67130.1 DHH family phosphoesterase [Methanofollis tationis]
MSIQAAAERVAAQILATDFVEVYAHHDADGIAAAAILCQAMLRAGRRFRLRVRPGIGTEDIVHPDSTLLCDFGAGLADLPGTVMVVDHHVPHFEGPFHVNPRLAGIDGEQELTASGTAYLVAQEMGDNRDLAGLALLGVFGDGQKFSGMNLEILNEGIANGFVVPERGFALPGGSVREALMTAVTPYIPGISGDADKITRILEQAAGEEAIATDLLLSLLVLEAGEEAAPSVFSRLYGGRYRLEREVIDDARTLAAVIDGCGQQGRGGLAAAVCLRSPDLVTEAEEVAGAYRARVLAAVMAAERVEETGRIYRVADAGAASGVADCLANDVRQAAPVAVVAENGTCWQVSVRCPPGVDLDLEALLRRLAAEVGGSGGGHRSRAGARIPLDRIDEFEEGFLRGIAA